MKTALIYYPSLDGHRQVYSQYILNLLLERNYFIYLCSDSSQIDKDFPYLKIYRQNPFIHFEPVENPLEIKLPEFRKQQERLNIDLTIFPEADNHLDLISQQLIPGAGRLHGKNIGIFLRSINYIHFPKKPFSLRNTLRYIKHFHRKWGSDSVIFHEFNQPVFRLLDAAVTLDEYFKAQHPGYYWLPDIVFPLVDDATTLAQAETLRWELQLTKFLKRNKEKGVLLYFGEAQKRRGYDTLLKLACEFGCRFIHCGLRNDSDQYQEDIIPLRSYLDSQGLLFETNEYIQYTSTMQVFFNTCNYVILPYRNHLGSSGVMYQAIFFGRPVLVPNQGLMAKRVIDHNLGLVYQPDNYQDLITKWKLLKETASDYSKRLSNYKDTYSKERVAKALETVLTDLNL